MKNKLDLPLIEKTVEAERIVNATIVGGRLLCQHASIIQAILEADNHEKVFGGIRIH